MPDNEDSPRELQRPWLAERINYLVNKTWPDERKRPGVRAIAKQITAAGGGAPISGTYLWLLATGQRDNPTVQQIESLATFFGVSPSYFFYDQVDGEVNTDRQLLAALRDRGVMSIALRSEGLSARSRQAIIDMIDRAREIERLEPIEPSSDDRDRT